MPKQVRKFEFTRESVTAIELPTDSDRIDYFDKNLPGLQLRVSKTGTKKFRLVVKKDGRNVYVNIGSANDLSITAVRKIAKQKKAQILLGQHSPTKQTLKQPSVGEVFQSYLRHHQFNPEAPKADAQKVRRQFDRFVFSQPRFCRLDASQLEVEDCVAVIRAGMEAGNTTGNHLLRSAKAAVNWGQRAPTNPKAPAEFSHWKLRFNPFAQMQLQPPSKEQDERFLSAQELAVAYRFLDEEPQPYREMLRFLFLSGGIRLRQLTRITWEDIDKDNMTMRLRDLKGRRQQARIYYLPMTEKMLETLQSAHPGERPLSNGRASQDEDWVRRISRISHKMNGVAFSAKHIRKTGWSLMRNVPIDAKRYWLSDDLSSVAQRHYDFFDHRDDILQGMLQWQALCEARL
jgi:integrase